MERNEATEPVMKAGITLLKKNSAIDTSKKQAITCARVLLTCRYSVMRTIPTKHPKESCEIKDGQLTEDSRNADVEVIYLLRVRKPDQVIKQTK